MEYSFLSKETQGEGRGGEGIFYIFLGGGVLMGL